MNRYQLRKAKLIAATLILAAGQSENVPMTQLAQLAASMDHRGWVTVSLQAGVPVADYPCKVLVVALLGRLA